MVERAGDFGPDGSFRGHFHSRVATAAGVLQWGLFSGQPDLVRWAHGVYRFARTIGTRFGWFPEFVGRHACETCGITDMIDIAIQLARSGRHECWGDAERFGRNHLVESQFVDADWERQVPKLTPAEAADFIAACPPPQLKREGVRDVLPGAFSGGSAPSGVVDPRRGHWWMGCCNAHGVHGLYLLWHHAVHAAGTAVRVDMLFDRSTPWADVRSHLPRDGAVEVVMRQGGSLAVRTPEDVSEHEVAVEAPGRWRWLDGYVHVDGLATGQVVTIRFPLREQDERVSVLGDQYLVSWRGDTVMAIDPPGRVGPLYRRRESPGDARSPHHDSRHALRLPRASRVEW